MLIRKETVEKLKTAFGLETVTLDEFKDKYGLMVNIKELNSCNYKRCFKEHVDRIVEEYQYAMKAETLEKLREIAEIDNLHARFLGKREYEVIRVYVSNKPYLGFGALIRFKDDGELRYMYETGLNYCLSGHFEKYHEKDTPWWYGRENRTYYTAGGIEDKDVDFIFHGVGHYSKSGMYCREEEEIFR